MKRSDCRGCRDDFYNRERGGCWSFDAKKKLRTRYFIHMDAPMDKRSNFRAAQLPECYHTSGYSSPACETVVNEIPRGAK